MEEPNLQYDEDSIPDIDWSATAYTLPEPHLITEKSFNENVRRSYKEYFNLIKDLQLRSTSNEYSAEQQLGGTFEHSAEELGDHSKKILNAPIHEKLSRVETMQEMNQQRLVEFIPLGKTSKTNKLHLKGKKTKCAGKRTSTSLNTTYHLLMAEPRWSRISERERRFYHYCLKHPTEVSEDESLQRRFQALLSQVQVEQNEYQHFLHSCASSNLSEYLHLHEKTRKLAVDDTHASILKLLHPPQVVHKLLRALNVQLSPNVQENPVLSFVRRVHEEGVIPKYNLPEPGVKLPDYQRSTDINNEVGLSREIILTTCMCEGAQVYMKRAALLAIMEGLVVKTREWLVSVEIKEVSVGNGKKEKVVIFSDPLPRRVMTSREVNNGYYCDALKVLLHDIQLACKDGDEASREMSNSGQPQVPGEERQPQVPGEEELDESEATVEQHTAEQSSHVNLFRLLDLNILFECTVHQHDVASGRTFQISPKCEYQYTVGFEQFSIVDLCQLWWDSKIANTDWIVCSRIDILNDVIVRNDQYTRDVLCPPGCPYDPKYFSNQLYDILKELLSLPCGEYILEHPVAENCIKVFVEDCEQGSDVVDAADMQNDSCAITYQTIYKSTIATKDLIVEYASPWLPIDTTILSEKFVKNKWIPCLFSQFNHMVREIQRKGPKMMARKKIKKPKLNFKQLLCEDSSNVDQLPPDAPAVSHITNRKVTNYAEEEF